MRRLVLASALVPLAFSTSAYAQTAPDDVVKLLWCAEAYSVLYASQKPQVTPDIEPMYEAFLAAAAKLIDNGTQGYLNAGFTEEQVTKVKADLVTEVTPVVTGDGQQPGRFGPDDCNPLLHAVLVLPPSSEMPPAPAPDASAAPPAPASTDSSDAPMPASSAASSSAQ